MLTWILGGIAAALLAAALLWLFRPRKKPEEPEVPLDLPLPAQLQELPPESYVSRRHELIEKISSKVTFSQKPVKLKSVKVGERLEPTLFATGESEVRPIQNVGELPRVLPRSHGLPDDMFFGQVASGQLPVVEHLDRVDIVEDRYGVPRNVLVYLTDVSPSMEEFGRKHWSKFLCERLIDRAEREGAEFVLIPFCQFVCGTHHVRTKEEFAWLRQNLDRLLSIQGGTDIDGVLSAGMDVIEQEDFTGRKLMLVTDGTQGINVRSTVERLRELGIELHAVCIGQVNRDIRTIARHFDHFPDQQ